MDDPRRTTWYWLALIWRHRWLGLAIAAAAAAAIWTVDARSAEVWPVVSSNR